MKTDISRATRRSSRGPLFAFVLTAVTGIAHSAASFPDYPLQTGTGSVPPNIMFILDDSGSMAWEFMPGARFADGAALDGLTSPVAFGQSTYVHNKLFYNPSVTYKPWLKADGTRVAGGNLLTNVYADLTLAGSGTAASDISGTTHTFYVPISATTDLANSNDYFRFQIMRVGSATRVVRSRYLLVTNDNRGEANAGCNGSGTANESTWRECAISTPTGRTEAAEVANFATWYSFSRTRSKLAKGSASEAFGTLGENFRLGFDSIWNRGAATNPDGTPQTNADGSALPSYVIPVGNDGGLFRATNKAAWFSRLQSATASGGTPLHGALRRAGTYFEKKTDATGPWGPQEGTDQLSCRQNYSILTTDGYWNNPSGYVTAQNPSVGNSDGTAGATISAPDGTRTYVYSPTRQFMDEYTDTLADLAMHYWKRDLRITLGNNVPFANANPAFWQHMVTFGISIGEQGTLDPVDDVPLIAAGDKSWPDPWNGPAFSWANDTATRIDDLLHASVNSRGQFVSASDPEKFTQALRNSLAVIQRRRASGSNVTSNGPLLEAGSQIFQATYTSGEWSGDLAAVSIVGGVIAGNSAWSMAAVANADTRPFSSRGVFTHGGLGGATFPTAAQSSALTRLGGLVPVAGDNNAAYIKGDQSLEKQNGGSLRDRSSPIGDIVNSSPFYAKETNTLYVGANDGMMHAVNAVNGQVLFSYVPRGVDLPGLASLSDPDYQHRFFVDGGIDVSTTAQGQTLNVLAGSLGRGGRGVYGLNVSAPATFTSTNVLWDLTGSNADTDMGYVLGAPLVRKGSDGSTLVMVGNGVESNTLLPASSRAYLFVYRLSSSGTILQTIKIPAGTEAANGLAEPRAADTDGDGDVDFVYAGDLQGNVWKFDLRGNVSSWDNTNNVTRLFTATATSGVRQPITSAVALAREPNSNRTFVMVGTGRYISLGDLTTTATQSLYALIDSGSTIASRADLQARTIALTGVDSKGRAARSWESYSVLPTAKKGWYIDLTVPTAGERVVSAPFLKGRALRFSSIIPKVGAGCDSGGTGYFNAIDAFTGTNPVGTGGGGTSSSIDVDGDGTGNDRIVGSGGTADNAFVGSVDFGIGMPGQGTGVGNKIFVCGSDAECAEGGLPEVGEKKRLSWRELFKRD